MGRRKIAINKIRDARSLRLTYYKRKNGLLKKAIELSILCDVDVLLIIADKKAKKYIGFNSGFMAENLVSELGKQYATWEMYNKKDVSLASLILRSTPHFTTRRREPRKERPRWQLSVWMAQRSWPSNRSEGREASAASAVPPRIRLNPSKNASATSRSRVPSTSRAVSLPSPKGSSSSPSLRV